MRPILLTAMFLATAIPAAGSGAAQDGPDFHSQVQPILKKYCGACHGGADPAAGFSMATYRDLMNGVDGEPVVTRSDSNSSRLMQLIRGDDDPRMPPEDEPQLDADEIQLLERWIESGATAADGTERSAMLKVPAIPAPPELKSPVTAADWSSQGMLAVATFRQVQILDEQFRLQHTIGGLPGKVNSVRFSDDGRRLMIGSGISGMSGTALLWDRDRQEIVRTFAGHRDAVFSAQESPDGKRVATAGYDRRILIWDRDSGVVIKEILGHNDAIYDLEFSNDGRFLISASGDQTVKVWDIATGQRLDTLGQPLQEQFATRFSPDNRWIVAGGRDNRIRVWRFVSRGTPRINPLVHARFAHQGPIVQLAFTPDGSRLISTAEDKTVKIWETNGFRQIGSLPPQTDVCTALAVSPDGQRVYLGRADGTSEVYELPAGASSPDPMAVFSEQNSTSPIELKPASFSEAEPNNRADQALPISIPSTVTGTIASSDDVDLYRFSARQGVPIVLETKAARRRSPLDSRIEILSTDGDPVPRVLLRAVRDSYFTFRGKNSDISDDFRIHNWEEMQLNDYLYAGGEVVKLFLHPRGPDSGFRVYPGYGSRYGFFDTTPMSHALHEPCYIVRPYPVGTRFSPNGLPVFQLNFENDDDSQRRLGRDSFLYFTPPRDGEYVVRISDVRGQGGKDYAYELAVRHPQPEFKITLSHGKDLFRGGIHEFTVTAERIDRFEGAIKVRLENIPDCVTLPNSLTIQAGHNQAHGTLYLPADCEPPTPAQWQAIRIVATARSGNDLLSNEVNGFGEFEIHPQPKIKVRIALADANVEKVLESGPAHPLVVEMSPGEKVELKVVAERTDHQNRISFGKEDSGRNLPHGVYVADIGLNGLMLIKGRSEQRFFIQAEEWVQPVERRFHIRSTDVQGQASLPVIVRIVKP